jgi:tetratricopeptide (TPR) repeat protein
VRDLYDASPGSPESHATRDAGIGFVQAAIERGTAALLNLHGVPAEEGAATLHEVRRRNQDARCRYITIAIGDRDGPIELVARVYEAVEPSGARLLPRTGYALEELRNRTSTLTERLGHLQTRRRPRRCRRARWVRRRLRQGATADELLLEALALDLIAWTGVARPVWQVVLLVAGEDRYGSSAESASDAFVTALAGRLHYAAAPVTIVLARETAMPPGPGIVQHSVAVALPTRPVATGESLIDLRLERHSLNDRRLIGLAAMPRVFDRALLEAVAERRVDEAWTERELGRGTLERCGETAAGEPLWRVEPLLRNALFAHLAGGRDQRLFEQGHDRAIDHYSALPIPRDLEARFRLQLELAYHQAALTPRIGFGQIVRLADGSPTSRHRDRCQTILAAVEELHAATPAIEARTILLQVKLHHDLGDDGAAVDILDAAAQRHPLDGDFDPVAVTVELQRAKHNRLSGNYELALARYEKVEEEAMVADDVIVLTHCQWQRSLVLGRMHEVARASEAASAAQRGNAVLARDTRAGIEAGGYGIHRIDLKPAHLLRHQAQLRRLSGDYVDAHTSLSRACEIYEQSPNARFLAYAKVVRSDILRFEGDYEAAIERADDVLALFDDGSMQDERLLARARRASVLARLGRGELPSTEAERLASVPDEVDPAAHIAGLLAQAEIHRRGQRLPEAVGMYYVARGAATWSQIRGDEAVALIGLLECHRAGATIEDAMQDPETVLRDLLAHPCSTELPWLAVRSQLLRSYWRSNERGEALDAASTAVARFKRRPADARREEGLIEGFREAFEGGRPPPPIPLEPL